MTAGRPAALLGTHIAIRPQFRRSVNVERDRDESVAEDYIPTARAIDVLRRLCDAMRQSRSVRAFSLTGPYGAGKSSFALFLRALLGPSAEEASKAARAHLGAFDPDVLRECQRAMKAFGATEEGFIRAVATAQREPAALTVARALNHGAERYWRGRGGPRAMRSALRDAVSSPVTARELAALVGEMAECAPVVIVLDEFGKNLEYFAQFPDSGDIFLIQELAERVSGQAGSRALLLTLQHVAFEQYAVSASPEQRREWSKVQGRFHDISFLHDAEQTVRLIALSLDSDGASPRVRRDIKAWASDQYAVSESLGLVPQLVPDEEQVEGCYPVSPLAAVAVAELSARFGQHDRTLFSFLASDEPGSVARFLGEERAVPGAPPAIPVDAIWDYFLESAATSVRNSPDAARWLEIHNRVREVHGLADLDLRCVKAVGLLNLLARGGALRAAPTVVAFGLGISDKEGRAAVASALKRLEGHGLITYRGFADEYRVWEGTDFDISGALEASRVRLASESLAALLQRVDPLRPVVANRHSQRVGMLRFFDVRFLTCDDADLTPALEPEADGLLGVVLGGHLPSISVTDGRPVVLLQASPTRDLRDTAVEAAATLDALDSKHSLESDRVAKRELQERAAVATQALRAQLEKVLRSVKKAHLVGVGDLPMPGHSFARLASDVCDRVYPDSPHVKNEMLGRRDLTSQGAKARRELLQGMVMRGGLPELGMDHFRAERAMYEATLRHSGMHRPSEDGWAFAPPKRGDTWVPAWKAAEDLVRDAGEKGVAFDTLYAQLSGPPFGLKDGPIPVLLTALLLAYRDEIAVYQDGSYQPELTDGLLERLVKTPDRFAAKAIGGGGLRKAVVENLGVAIGAVPPPPRRRNPTVLKVVAPLLAAVRSLPEYTKRTNDLSPETVAVREVLLEARDPSDMLFTALPEACGMSPIDAGTRANQSTAAKFVEAVLAATEELTDAYPQLLGDSASSIAAAFAVPSEMPDLRLDLRGRARPLEGRVIDREMRSFLLTAIDASLDDEQWVEAMMFNVSGAAPSSWTDEDRARFSMHLAEIAGAFGRLVALHYDSIAAERAGFDARRVTITAPTGREVSSVYWVDHADADRVNAAAELALAALDPVLGPRSLPALIALLAGRADSSGSGELWAVEQAGAEVDADGEGTGEVSRG